ncbi:Multidrug resistance protein MdtA [termite gut metagenome]|uniref:Multidrug resistance protein MdtA n=1 Tax=termite gut metagenome TaxID=433724 RepID=A0A5J4QBR6_9ZZZZ
MKIYICVCFIATISLIGCDRGHKDSDVLSEESEYNTLPEEIKFTKVQAGMAGLQVQTVVPGPFRQVVKTSGQILAAQGDETTVVATSNGVVSFSGVSVADGTAFKSGEVIAVISGKNLLEGDPTEKVKVEYETALNEYRRAEELVKDKIISAKDFEQIRLRYETVKTAYEAHADNAIPNGVKVIAPLTGYVKNKLVSQGEYVSVGQPIVVISQNRRLQLRAEVPERYYKYLGDMNDAHFKPAYDNSTVYKISELNGSLLSFGKVSNSTSFYIPVTFEFNNAGDIIPGSFVNVYLLSAVQSDVISIPLSALTEEQGLFFVYLQLEDETYKKQEVTLGEEDGERVMVLSGLKSGDRVVVKGAYQIKLAAGSIMPEGHTHSH